MKKLKVITFILFLITCTVFYYNVESDYESEMKLVSKNYKLESNDPPIPSMSENDETFMGVDKNRNGVRDDLELWTKYNFKNEVVRKTLFKIFRNMNNQYITSNENNRVKTKELSDEISILINCLGVQGHLGKDINNEIMDKFFLYGNMYYNEPNRRIYRGKIDSMLGGDGVELSLEKDSKCKVVLDSL